MAPQPRLNVGETKIWTPMVDSDGNNIEDGWDGSSDFPANERSRDVANGYQYQTILNMTHSVTGGDVSIFLRFYAQPPDRYLATLTCRNENVSGNFATRLKLNEWKVAQGQQGLEWVSSNSEVSPQFKTISVQSGQIRAGYDAITIAARAHLLATNQGGGTSVVSKITLKRLS